MATARKTTTKKVAAKKAATLDEIQKLIDTIVDADADSGEYEYEELHLRVDGTTFSVWNGDENIDYYNTLDSARTELESILTKATPIVVKALGGDYSDDATLDSDGITVGCTTVSFAKFDELAEAVAKYRARN